MMFERQIGDVSFYYKNVNNFKARDGICYIAESEFEDKEVDEKGFYNLDDFYGYSYDELLEIVKDGACLSVEELFDLLDGECPEDLYEDLSIF